MRFRTVIAALVITTASAALAAPQQFDLVCTGAGADTRGGAFTPIDIHLRIDLARKLWCEDPPAGMNVTACAVLKPIADVQPGVIWLTKASDAEDAAGVQHWTAVNRETGEYTGVEEVPGVEKIAAVSDCQPAPFSGFPAVQTKF